MPHQLICDLFDFYFYYREMNSFVTLIAAYLFLLMSNSVLGDSSESCGPSIFDHSVENVHGEMTALSSFKGKKAYLIVNVASA